MLIHVTGEFDCVFAEAAVSPMTILEGSGICLSDALRDLAIQIDDFEDEMGVDVV